MNLLTIVYWWFLPVYWLKNQVQIVLEMRVDEKVTRSMTQEKMLDYVSTLVEMNEKITKNVLQKKLRFSSSFFFAENRNVLSYRVQYLLGSKQKKKTNKGILLFVFMLPEMCIRDRLYTHPVSKFAAEFIGHYNIMTPVELTAFFPEKRYPGNYYAIRPETFMLSKEPIEDPAYLTFDAKVVDFISRGNVLRYTCLLYTSRCV